ncbi:MAG: aminopeptidase P family protein [Chloroflexi bacterium]|nr:aminopeptidase P family protein [Chloroflexota bacterium]
MKSDLDRLMAERNIDALIIPGNEEANPYRDYLANGVHASATVIKKRGSDPVLIANGMELDEAAKSGLKVHNMTDFGMAEILQKYRSDQQAVSREFWRNILTTLGIKGRVAFYGTGDVMKTWKMLKRFERDYPDLIEIIEDDDTTIFHRARRSKDAAEIAKLRDAGQRSSKVMTETREWLAGHKAKNNVIYKADGTALTIGDVKHFVRLKLMEYGLEDAEGMIFAQGRDAGLPHSRGEEDQPLELGKSIVFDLFPRPIGGGYYHDMTRTWSLGYATPEVEEAHRLVMYAFTQSLESLTVGQRTRDLQELVCDIFEEHGHPTPKTKPGGSEGYTHSLGHGLGLDVHESPSIGNYSPDDSVFQTGDVITIEPGLYYPEKGWGIRIEDSVYLDESGTAHNLTDTTYELVIPIQNQN